MSSVTALVIAALADTSPIAYAYYRCRGSCRAVNIAKTTERAVRRRAHATATDFWLHAARERWRAARLARSASAMRGSGSRNRAEAESDSSKARSLGRSVSLRADDRHRDV